MTSTIRHILLVLALVAAGGLARAQDSTLTVSLHQQLINRLAAAALPHVETRRYRGEVDLAVTRRPWDVTVRYTVQAVEALVRTTHIEFNAKVRVQGQNIDYTSIARGRLDASVSGGKLRLVAKNMTLPLSVAPFGARIDIGTIPADDFLPAAYRTLEIDLAALALPVALANQRAVNIRLTSARVETKPPFLLVHSTIGL